jgi:hypothetical protein
MQIIIKEKTIEIWNKAAILKISKKCGKACFWGYR